MKTIGRIICVLLIVIIAGIPLFFIALPTGDEAVLWMNALGMFLAMFQGLLGVYIFVKFETWFNSNIKE